MKPIVHFYKTLCDVAAEGSPLPTCSQLAEELDLKREKVGDYLAFLIAAGMIVLDHRQCLIVATGERTA